MFLYYARVFFTSGQPGVIPLLALSLGMIILIRPVNGLIIFALPFIAGNFKSLIGGLITAARNYKWLLTGILIVLAITSIQGVIYKISTGNFLVYSYQGEGFNFLNPHIADILFSYKKGLFLYTPIFLVSLTGCIYLWKSSRFSLLSWLAFFFLITYVFSSWWMWYYGGSFSSRVYVEFIPIFMILLAMSLHSIQKRTVKTAFVALLLALVVMCQIQTYQYRYYQIHWSDMTSEKYWEVFLRVDKLIK
jgi:hypothetical protein